MSNQSISNFPNLLEMRLDQSSEEEADAVIGHTNGAENLARETELKAMIEQAYAELNRFEMQFKSTVERCCAIDSEIPDFEAMVEMHKNAFNSIGNTQQRLTTGIDTTKATWDQRFASVQRPTVVKKEQFTDADRVALKDKLTMLQKERAKLQTKQRRVKGMQSQYEHLCKLEKKLTKKQPQPTSDDKVSSNQN